MSEEYSQLEEGIYEAIRGSQPNCQLRNYISNRERKWFEVGYFETDPRDWPSRSKELVVVAKFTGEGDAMTFVNILSRRPEAKDWWAVVVR